MLDAPVYTKRFSHLVIGRPGDRVIWWAAHLAELLRTADARWLRLRVRRRLQADVRRCIQ
jgi:hypothetical protein